jgi:hypothetical protein
MRLSKSMVVVLSLSMLSGCVAPLTSNFSGRSLGKGKVEFDVGGVSFGDMAVGAFKFAYGATPNFDLGIQFEYGCAGLFGKYAIRNPKENGLAFAALIGGGMITNGSYFYAGPILSFKMNLWEPYIVGRYNYVNYKEILYSWNGCSEETKGHPYFQFTFGSIFWISRKIGFNIELSTLSGDTDFTDIEGPLIAGGFKIRF